MHDSSSWTNTFGTKGVLLFENFPCGIEFGFDCAVHETGPRFRGLSGVPRGIHFVYYGHTQTPRCGYFTRVDNDSRLLLRSWNSATDELVGIASQERIASEMEEVLKGEFNSFLAPCSEDSESSWRNISNFISPDVLTCASCSLESTVGPGADPDLTEADRKLTAELKDRRGSFGITSSSFEGDLPSAVFCPVKAIEAETVQETLRSAGFAQQLSRMHLDSSWLLERMVDSYYFGKRWESMLGELQLAFVLFMMLYSYHSLTHWKMMISYICQSEKFLQQNQAFSTSFIKVLFHQINYIPADFFESEIGPNSFILPALTTLFSALTFPECSSELHEHRNRLETYIRKKFGIRVALSEVVVGENETTLDAFCEFEGSEGATEDTHLPQSYDGNSSHNDDVMDPLEAAAQLYCWRYPAVYDAMKASNGKEDMLMAAMRLYDETARILSEDPKAHASVHSAYLEAIKFIENEGPLL